MAEHDNLARKIDDQIAAVNRSKTVTIVIYLVLCVIIFAYTTYMRGMIKDALDPKGIADLAGQRVMELIPRVRQEASTKVKEVAPQFVDNAIAELRTQIPEIRAKALSYVISQLEAPMDNLETELWGHIESTLAQHGGQIREMIEELEDEEKLTRFEDTIFELIASPLEEPGIKVDLETYATTLRSIETRIKHLVDGENLSESEQIERHLLVAIAEISRRSPTYQERDPATKDLK